MSNWHSCTVGSLVNEKIIAPPMDGNHGETHPKGDDFTLSGIPFVMASDINNSVIDFNGCKFISKEQADSLRKGFAQEGDVLLSHKATIGRTAIVPRSQFPYLMLTPQVTYYRILDKEKLDNRFLKYYFDSYHFQKTLGLWAGAGSTRAYIGITGQHNLPLKIPNIESQKKIANVLSALDKKIELNNKINTELEAMAKLIYDYWFMQFDFPDANGKPYKSSGGKMVYNEALKRDIPDGWGVESLEKSGVFKNGKGIKKGQISEAGRYKIFGSNGIIGKTDVVLFECPVIAIGRVGANYGEVHYSLEPCWVSDNAVTAQPLSSEWYWWLLQTLKTIDYNSIAGGSAQPLITQGKLKSLEFSMPNTSLMHDYFDKVNSIFLKIQNIKEQNEKLTELRDWLLPMLMNGQVTVKEA